jgi:AraC-like DNA-binding protein
LRFSIESGNGIAVMSALPLTRPARRATARPREEPFSEVQTWAGLGGGWQHLHGSFQELGYSVEWHDFTAKQEFDWASSFHPDGVEICLNLAGQGNVSADGRTLGLAPMMAGYYFHGLPGLSARRSGGERHQFITVELSLEFLRRNLPADDADLDDEVRRILAGKGRAQVSEPIRLTSDHQLLVASLRRPPVYASAQRLWYRAKALEVASVLFYRPAGGSELFCQRQKLLNQERVQKVIAVLREELSETPTLETIGRRVGCSHFHLSRIFSQETGQPIFQYLRQLRMERAAELLRERRLNVTQVALEVGYASPSHFSMAFHETYGCCPGLYPLATQTQRAGVKG